MNTEKKTYSVAEIERIFLGFFYNYKKIDETEQIIRKLKTEKKFGEVARFEQAKLNFEKDFEIFLAQVNFIIENIDNIQIVQIPLDSILREKYQLEEEYIESSTKLQNLEKIFNRSIENLKVEDSVPEEYSSEKLDKEIRTHQRLVYDLETALYKLQKIKHKKVLKKKKSSNDSFETMFFQLLGL